MVGSVFDERCEGAVMWSSGLTVFLVTDLKHAETCVGSSELLCFVLCGCSKICHGVFETASLA